MDGYRYWVERHKLLVELERQKASLAGMPAADRPAKTAAVEQAFRVKLDVLYGQVRDEFEPATPSASREPAAPADKR
jgi:hypothetical protein